MVRYMQGVKDDKESLETFKTSFCDKYLQAFPTRTDFVKNIKSLSADTFDFECQNKLTDDPLINVWFNPIDPMVSISQQQVCDLHKKLFASL